MLAQNLKSAIELGISENQMTALVTVLGMLERGELKHAKIDKSKPNHMWPLKFSGLFNMGEWQQSFDCGTVCCIGGTAELLSGEEFENMTEEVEGLFYPNGISDWGSITPEQAACALRSFLTTGNANWADSIR